MKVSEQERRLHDAQGHKLGLLAAALGAFAIAAAICNGAMPTPVTPESIWPTQEWRTSSPEEEGMDSRSLLSWLIGGHPTISTACWYNGTGRLSPKHTMSSTAIQCFG